MKEDEIVESTKYEGKTLLIYHKEDNDGVFSGALIYDYLIHNLQMEREDVIAIGMDYNDIAKFKRKDIKEWRSQYEHLFITDLSFPIPLMEYMHKLWGKHFTWCDHHRPVIEASNRSKKALYECGGERRFDRSAILCVYKWLYDPFDLAYRNEGDDKLPEIYRILSAWDSFTYEQEGYTKDYVRKVNYGITHLFNLNFNEVIHFLEYADFDDLQKIVQKANTVGTILCHDEDNRMMNNILRNGDMSWSLDIDDGEDHSACAIFQIGPSNSIMFDCVKDKVRHGIVFKRNANGNWTISVYNTNEKDMFHIGNYLRNKYKGGGHCGAGGFQVKQSKVFKMLKTKKV